MTVADAVMNLIGNLHFRKTIIINKMGFHIVVSIAFSVILISLYIPSVVGNENSTSIVKKGLNCKKSDGQNVDCTTIPEFKGFTEIRNFAKGFKSSFLKIIKK